MRTSHNPPRLYACLYRPPAAGPQDRPRARAARDETERESSACSAGSALDVVSSLVAVAREFSPRYECRRDDVVVVDVSGLDRLIGSPRMIGEELRREAAARGVHVHVALAATRSAALVLALACPGVTVVEAGTERDALARLPVAILEKITDPRTDQPLSARSTQNDHPSEISAVSAISAVNVVTQWGVRTLGELAALPSADLASRLGQAALAWQAISRGEDVAPLVPAQDEERFDATLELEWPVEGLEPLSFVLTRLLEPLSIRLERRDRGVAVLHLELRLVTRDTYARQLQLPSPMRDVRTLRTLLLLDLDANPPPAAIDRVTIVIDPTPGRVVQHTLFTRAQPTPEQLSTLVARLDALMGRDRIGAPATVDSYRPGAFRMEPFATEHDNHRRDRGERKGSDPESANAAVSSVVGDNDHDDRRRTRGIRSASDLNVENSACSAISALNVVSALRRCRMPIPARAVIEAGRPVRVTTDRRGFVGGAVLMAIGPWRTSGEWWTEGTGRAGRAGGQGRREGQGRQEGQAEARQAGRAGALAPFLPALPVPPSPPWDRDEWEVVVAGGAVYRIFQERTTEAWFIDAIVD
jgi:hypothetical protein